MLKYEKFLDFKNTNSILLKRIIEYFQQKNLRLITIIKLYSIQVIQKQPRFTFVFNNFTRVLSILRLFIQRNILTWWMASIFSTITLCNIQKTLGKWPSSGCRSALTLNYGIFRFSHTQNKDLEQPVFVYLR